jgi:hypothetical protein
VLHGVGDEVPARLCEPDRVGADERAPAQRLDRQLGPEGARERPPRLGGVVEQRADVDELRPLARTVPAARRREVVERELRPPELEVDRRRAVVVERVEAEPGRAERAPELVAGVGDEGGVPDEPRLQHCGQPAARSRCEPPEEREAAHAACSTTGPSIRR